MLKAFKPLKTLEIVYEDDENFEHDEIINWLPLIKELPITHFTLSGYYVSRNDIMQMIDLPLKNKRFDCFIKGQPEEDYPLFNQLFVDNGQGFSISGSS